MGPLHQAALAVTYGMGPHSLAIKLNQSVAHAQELLNLHKRVYPRFWRWSDATVLRAYTTHRISTVFGWQMLVTSRCKQTSIANFPMQANGAEMLRIAIIHCVKDGIKVIAPVHDAILIEASVDTIDAAVESASKAMRQASREVLGGFELRNDFEIVKYPDRYQDERGQVMWDSTNEVLKRLSCD